MNEKMKTWRFGVDNNRLVDLVLRGKKTATTSIYEGNSISKAGEESILLYENEQAACITKTVKVIITEFKNITKELSELEGEGDFEEWKATHMEFFRTIKPEFDENTKVEFEIFEVVEILAKEDCNL